MTAFRMVKKFSVTYGTPRFITDSTRSHHWTSSWATWIQSKPSHNTSLRSLLIHPPSTPTSPQLSLLLQLSDYNCICISQLHHAFYMSNFTILHFITLLLSGEEYNNFIKMSTWATGWTIGVLGFDSRRGLGIFLFTTAYRTALRPTQPPIQWVPGAPFLGVKRPGGVKLITHLHLVPKSMSGAISLLSQYTFMAWRSVKAQGQIYLPWVMIYKWYKVKFFKSLEGITPYYLKTSPHFNHMGRDAIRRY
jgi:hypothetical protein